MPSNKKKSKGSKGRKTAAKAGKQLVNEEEETTNMEEQKGSLNSKMNGLKIDRAEDDFLEEAIKLAAAEKKELEAAAEKKEASEKRIKERENCKHGYAPSSPSDHVFCKIFMGAFWESFNIARNRDDSIFDDTEAGGITECLLAGIKGMTEKCSDVLSVPNAMKLFRSYCLRMGTVAALDGEDDSARIYATAASFFEQMTAMRERKALIDFAKLNELTCTDEHTLVQFFRKRIPCSCLDEKYKEVKHITKMGICWNPQCKLPDRTRVKRSGMVYCVQCRLVNYCSRECQEVNWPNHKEACMAVTFDKKRLTDESRI